MITIQVARSLPVAAIPASLRLRLEKAARLALERAGASAEAGLSIVITDDSQLQALNQRFLGNDAPTDVLSFPAEGADDPDTGQPYLGDVLISYPRAQAQADAAGHSLEAELCLLLVHGILHLAGHDHADEPGKTAMWSLQDQILEYLGFPSLKIVEE